MKKFLLMMVAAFMVAMGASAQVAKTSAKFALPEGVTLHKMTKMQDATNVIAKKAVTRRADVSLAGTYIIESSNWDGDFTENSEFTMEDATGTIKAGQWNEESNKLEFTVDFEYNVVLKGFSLSYGTAYGYFDQEKGYLIIPVQSIYNHPTYGNVVLTGSVRGEEGGVNYGYPILLNMTEDGGFVFDEEYATGWYSFLPDYEKSPNATWNYGFEAAVYAPNAIQTGVEVHIQNGGWGNWTRTNHNAYVEDFESEIVVHNFFGLCPISITVEGDVASIATPIRVMDDDFAAEGATEPDYMMIHQYDATFDNIVDGSITGKISVDEKGKYIEFYDTEYREATYYTENDEIPEGKQVGDVKTEAGNYVVKDYTKWFIGHTTMSETGAYWWGEAQQVGIFIPNLNPSGISDVKSNAKNSVAKTFNLMGQEVSKSAKGLVIRDGKKYVNK